MKATRWRWRRGLAAALVIGLACGMAAVTGPGPARADSDTETAESVLGEHDAELLQDAEADGDASVTLIMATDTGEAPDVSDALADLGAVVARQFDETGYVLASVPTENAVAAAALPGVAAADVDEVLQLPDPRVDAKEDEAALDPVTDGPGADTPAANPFLPTSETGAVTFKEKHPEYDGRGVTIGIMDSGIDLDHPALRTTSTGERKIVDWVTETDPVIDGDGSWLVMVSKVTGPTFTYQSATWTAPAGTFRIRKFDEKSTSGASYGGDVNRDGDTADTFGVLYDETTHDVRVDTDQDRDFTNNPVLRPYRENYDVGHFGVDDPDTGVRETVPFVVDYRTKVDLSPLGGANVGKTYDFVNIGIPSSEHGTHVAGITAGADLFGSPDMDGAAPGAKLVSARACLWSGACSASALTTGMVDLVENHHVDLINMSIGGITAMNDGGSARSLLYNRLITNSGVQIFLSAGNNGPGVNTIGDPSTSSDAVAVGATISKETALADYGAPVSADQAVQNFSSRGPREDGGFKPNIVAPGAAISTVPLWLTGLPTPGVGYTLPPGYALLQGTSMASPQATGGAALLLSAAKSRGIAVTPAALRRAIYTSASWLDGTAAHAQGNGLLDVPAAWSLLQGSLETRTYAFDAPVCTPLSAKLATPNHGVGIYNRCPAASGGHRPGGTLTYPVTVTRTSGPEGAVATGLRWVGDDGTFSSAGTVSLPLNTPVALPVKATPPAGVHSAVLRIDDPSTAMIDAEMLNTVVAASQELNHPPLYTSWWSQLTVDRNSANSTFVNVPAGTTQLAFRYVPIVSSTDTGDGQLRVTATNPLGLPADDDASVCYSNYSANCSAYERAYPNPVPGVWEFRVESRRTSPEATSRYSIAAAGTGLTYTSFVKGSGKCGNHWLLDGDGGETNGTGSDMTMLGGSYGAEGRKPNGRTAAHFSGASGQGLVARGVQQMRPSGFNVAAWVRMEDNTRDQTIVGEYGPESGVVFELGYRADLGAWSFTTTAEDGSTIRLTSTAATQPQVWTNIIVSYYEYRGFVLYVNGKTVVAQSAVPRVGYPEFTSIGRTHWKNADRTAHPDKPWSGSISDVCIGTGYISEDEAKWFGNPDFDIVTTPTS